MRLLLIAFCLPFVGFTQQVNLDIGVYENGYALENAKIEVSQYGQVLVSETTTNSGQVMLILPLNYEYQVKIFKSGYITKIGELNLRFKDASNQPEGNIKVPMDINMYKNCSQADYSILDSVPVIKYHLDEKNELQYDAEYSKTIINKVNAIQVSHLDDGNKKIYYDYYNKGQELMKSSQYNDAIVQFEKAKLLSSCGDINEYIIKCKAEAKK